MPSAPCRRPGPARPGPCSQHPDLRCTERTWSWRAPRPTTMWVPQRRCGSPPARAERSGAAPEGDAPPHRDPGPLVLEPSLGSVPARRASARVRTRGHDDVPPGRVEHTPGRRFVLDLLKGDDIRVEHLDLAGGRREVPLRCARRNPRHVRRSGARGSTPRSAGRGPRRARTRGRGRRPRRTPRLSSFPSSCRRPLPCPPFDGNHIRSLRTPNGQRVRSKAEAAYHCRQDHATIGRGLDGTTPVPAAVQHWRTPPRRSTRRSDCRECRSASRRGEPPVDGGSRTRTRAPSSGGEQASPPPGT